MLTAHSMQYLNQLGGLNTHVDISDNGVAKAYKLVPCSHYHNGNAFPHDIVMDLQKESHKTTTIEGLQYYLIPETTINAEGTVTQYVQPEPAPNLVTTEAPPAAAKYLKRERRS